jgi:hypothetical protein
MWELEFQSVWLTERRTGRGLIPQPLVRLLIPTTKLGLERTPLGTFSARGLLHLPLRRLLYLCYCLSELHKSGKWPPQNRVMRSFVAGSAKILAGADSSNQPLANISRGVRSLTCDEFMRVWTDMCGFDEMDEAPMPPWPLYYAAQLMTILYVRKDNPATTAPVTCVILVAPPYYNYWWNRYLDSLLASGFVFGKRRWPAYLTAA